MLETNYWQRYWLQQSKRAPRPKRADRARAPQTTPSRREHANYWQRLAHTRSLRTQPAAARRRPT